jgi:SAM-dependent methyltransferase
VPQGEATLKTKSMMPVRFKRFYRELRGRDFALLDVGCGNHSPKQTRKWFPKCRYSGIDRELYNLDESDLAAMTTFFRIDLQRESLSAVPDRAYDVILFSHVIEHLTNGLEVLADLAGKLAPGGRLYVEFPSERSLRLPSMKGTLNFHDDPTHVRLYTVAEVRGALEGRGLEILRAGRRRDLAHIVLCPVHLLYNLIKNRRLSAAALWDLLGFADYVYAVSHG